MKVTPDNVSRILETLDLPEIIKVLNLDIDSYDYFVLEKLLNDFKFQFLILEINPIFPMSVDFTVEYDELFNWSGDSFQGASVSMFYKLLNLYQSKYYLLKKSYGFSQSLRIVLYKKQRLYYVLV